MNPSPELKKKCSLGAPGKDLGLSTGPDDCFIIYYDNIHTVLKSSWWKKKTLRVQVLQTERWVSRDRFCKKTIGCQQSCKNCLWSHLSVTPSSFCADFVSLFKYGAENDVQEGVMKVYILYRSSMKARKQWMYGFVRATEMGWTPGRCQGWKHSGGSRGKVLYCWRRCNIKAILPSWREKGWSKHWECFYWQSFVCVCKVRQHGKDQIRQITSRSKKWQVEEGPHCMM